MKMKWVYYLIGANLVLLVVLLSMMSMVPSGVHQDELLVPLPTQPTDIETRHTELPEDVGSEAWCDAIVLMRHRDWTDDEVRAFSAHCLYDLSE